MSSRLNGQDLLLDEDLLLELFGLSNKGCAVKKEKGVTNFYDEEGNKVVVDIAEIKQILLERADVVTLEAKLLDQNYLGVFWKMVHLSFTRILQPKQHTRSPYTNQDLIQTYGKEVNFAYFLVDWILGEVKIFNLPTLNHLSRERIEHMLYASQLTKIFKRFGVTFEGYEVQRVKESKKI